ncbi:hypothetical protein ES703_77089 [subsurface metagenome]
MKMKFLGVLLALVLVLSFGLVLALPLGAAAKAETLECFDLTAVNADPLWVKTGVGAIIPASNCISGPLEVTRTTWDVGGSNNWLIEAVVSSLLPGIADEAGARIWVRARMDGDSEFQYRNIQVRLMKPDHASDADNFIGVYNHLGNLAQTVEGSDAKIVLRWDQTSPRYRISLMRQGGEIIMAAEPSNDTTSQSVAVPLNTTNFPPLIGIPNLQQVGFGNGKASGNQISTWESICVIADGNASTVENLLDFIDDSVVAGTLEGDGPGNSADNRLNALKNMIEAAGDLIDAGDTSRACQQLLDAYKKCDGDPKPPDFVRGPAASTLAGMIQQLRDNLGCGK